jgi:hypothetical protein
MDPQQCIYAAMHQDYSEGYVVDDRANWPEESRAGEICHLQSWAPEIAAWYHQYRWAKARLAP